MEKVRKVNLEDLKELASMLNLNIKITDDIKKKIKNLHFKYGHPIPKIREILNDDFNELNWIVNGRPIKGLSLFILGLLGYTNWEDYKRNRKKIAEESESSFIDQLDRDKIEDLLKLADYLELDIKITTDILKKIKELHYLSNRYMIKI